MSRLVSSSIAATALLASSSCCFMHFDIPAGGFASLFLDMGTWSAGACGDVDGDGCVDLLLRSVVDEPNGLTSYKTWVLSGRDLLPIYSIAAPPLGSELAVFFMLDSADPARRGYVVGANGITSSPEPDTLPMDRGAFVLGPQGLSRFVPAEDAAPTEQTDAATEGSKDWTLVSLLGPDISGWSPGPLTQPLPLPDPFSVLAPVQARISAAWPALFNLQVCGDLDQDGELDWLGFTSRPDLVYLVSGRDMRILRTIPFDSAQLATVATGGFQLADVDGDGVTDWIVGAQASHSADHLTPRTCRLGVLSLVSGADLHVIRSLERVSFLAGPALTCPVVALPD